MSGDRQWTIERQRNGAFTDLVSGPGLAAPGDRLDLVEASRLTAVEAERDDYREGLEFYADRENYRDHVPEIRHKGYEAYPLSDDGKTARDVLARYPKNNETEQG